MLITEVSIKRPVFATVMMLTLLVLGMFSYRKLSTDLYPNVEFPVLTITTVYEGAPPETIEREVSRKIEEAINPVQGVKHISSNSQEGVSFIVVEFMLETKINDAAQDTRSKINAIKGDLPKECDEPIIQKMDSTSAPIISVSVKSDKLGPKELTTLVEKRVKRRLENSPGVGKVNLIGESKREVNIWLDTVRLESLGLGVNEVIQGLQQENVDTPLGRLNRSGYEFPVRVSGKPAEVSGYPEMIVAWKNGRPIRLREIATINDGIKEPRSLALLNGVPAISLDILKQSGANTVDVAAGIKKIVSGLSKELPEGVEIEIIRDSSTFILESVEDVQVTMILGGILTVIIVFCFLISWRSTVITGITLPISVISSFIIMQAMGFTLNMLTLMGLSLAIGLLIDDAIVVRENIVRHLQAGKDHITASLDGTKEIGLAVLATTLSIMAVFVPVAFMKGIIGRFFYQFGITVAFAVAISLFVSFTMDPMLSSKWHDPDAGKEHDPDHQRNFIFKALARFNIFFEDLADRYTGTISWALEHKKTVIAMGLGAFLFAIFMTPLVGSSFFTEYDQGELQINFEASPDAGLAETRSRTEAILKIVHGTPGVKLSYATIGAGDNGTVREGVIYIKLKDKKEREHSQSELVEIMRKDVQKIPGVTTSFVDPGSFDGRAPINLNLKGDDLEGLKIYSEKIKKLMAEVPGVVDINSSLDQEKSEVKLVVDRARAVDVGISTGLVVETLAPFIGGMKVSTYEDKDGDAYDLRIRLPEEFRKNPAQIGKLTLLSVRPDGTRVLVPVEDIAEFKMSISPAKIQRLDLRRQITLSGDTAEGMALGDAVNAIKKKVSTLGLPPGYSISWSGEAEDMAETFQYIFEALLLAIILIYLILAAQFESFVAPVSIMMSLPLSLVGVILTLFFTGDTLNIMSLIGLIMLMGLVTKNAILLVDYAKVLQKEGHDRKTSLIMAGRTRLRPIIMTTAAMIFGMLPLALAIGPGAEMRAPMARAVIGGLITSTLLTLIMVPVVYAMLDDGTNYVMRLIKGRNHE